MGHSQEALTTGLFAGLMALVADDDGGGSGGQMHSWSSLIGIFTAVAGNVLISVALNIQRYAHIRIDKEFVHDKVQREADWKRTRARGAVAGNGQHSRARGRHHELESERYRDDSSERNAHDDSSRTQHNVHGDLQDSVTSDQTVRPVDESQHKHRKSYLRSPYWWVGIVLMILGEAGNFLAYGFAPASIVSPLGVVALISNCVIAPFMLKEKFRKRDLWGVLVAIAGAAVVVLSAKSSEEKIGPHDIWVMITRWEFELYIGLTAALIVALMWASGKYGSRTILIDVGLVALFGGYTALSTKGVSSLLSFTLWHVITFPVTYLLVFVLVFSALMQIRYINRALRRFDSTQVIPTQFVLFTLSVIIGSAVLYRDFESFTAERATKFVGGCLLTFLGVYFITSGRVPADDESTYSIEDEEEAIGLYGERYRDEVDVSPRADARAYKPTQRACEGYGDEPRSPGGSLLSQTIEGFEDERPTPRGILSTVPSEQGSLTESLRAPSPEPPHSLITNPWVESQEQLVGTPVSEPQIRPTTPPDQAPDANAESTVLLQFPPAPGVDVQTDGVGQAQTPATLSSTQPAQPAQEPPPPQTPPPRRIRNSISVRFSPGHLLPTLSGGFSAVVAESLRRGEGSPIKDRKGRRRSDRRKRLSSTAVDRTLREHGDEARETEYDSDGAVNADEPTTTSIGAVSAGGRKNNADSRDADDQDPTSLNHLRSLSDSWSGPTWLGGMLRRSAATVANESAVQGDENAAVSEENRK